MKFLKTSETSAPFFLREGEKGVVQFDIVGDTGTQEIRVMLAEEKKLEIDVYFQSIHAMEILEGGNTKDLGHFYEYEKSLPSEKQVASTKVEVNKEGG